jgi:alpha-tubulin suppressor-like RCC1 family protein
MSNTRALLALLLATAACGGDDSEPVSTLPIVTPPADSPDPDEPLPDDLPDDEPPAEPEPDVPAPDVTPPEPGSPVWSSVSAGWTHTCAIRIDGTLWCWGDNAFGQLGNGSTAPSRVPRRVGAASNWYTVAAGRYHTCGIRQTLPYSIWCWGRGDDGQLGNGAFANSAVPVQVAWDDNTWSLSAGMLHTCFTAEDGRHVCWGEGARGQLGIESKDEQPLPVTVEGAGLWGIVSAGGVHGCTTTSDEAALWCWGDNGMGQVGVGAAGGVHAPTVIASTFFQTVSAGTETSCAIRGDSTLWCWGHLPAGLVLEPLYMGGGKAWFEVDTGGAHGCATRSSDYSLACWGLNDAGQLGLGDTKPRPKPETVQIEGTWLRVSAGERHTCGVTDPGHLWCWGDNAAGQLGTGDTASTTRPAPVAD